MISYKGYATRERFLQRIRQNPPNLRKILSRDGVFNEIVIARHAQLNRNSLQIAGLIMALTGILLCKINYVQSFSTYSVVKTGAYCLLYSFIRNGAY